MIRRYEEANVTENEENESYYKTRFLPDVERRPEDIIVEIETKDRLDRIAFRYYDDSKLWWVIAAANNLGRGNWSVPAGTRLRIPQNLSDVSSEANEINSKR